MLPLNINGKLVKQATLSASFYHWNIRIAECHCCSKRLSSIIAQSQIHSNSNNLTGLQKSLEYAQNLYCTDCSILQNAYDDSYLANL